MRSSWPGQDMEALSLTSACGLKLSGDGPGLTAPHFKQFVFPS